MGKHIYSFGFTKELSKKFDDYCENNKIKNKSEKVESIIQSFITRINQSKDPLVIRSNIPQGEFDGTITTGFLPWGFTVKLDRWGDIFCDILDEGDTLPINTSKNSIVGRRVRVKNSKYHCVIKEFLDEKR